MIVADSSAVIALINADDRHHDTLRTEFVRSPHHWVLPWAILPEVDYLLSSRVGRRAQDAFLSDVAAGTFSVVWHESDLRRACEIHDQYDVGLVDGVVVATAERLEARAIATLDLKHLGAMRLKGPTAIYPRDLE